MGTAQEEPGQIYDAIRAAIRIGYRHFDCAPIYKNQEEIGQALNDAMDEGEVGRDELFITSKLWNTDHEYDEVEPALEKTLEELQLDYLDLYLIHWPIAQQKHAEFPKGKDDYLGESGAPLIDTWTGMEDCLDSDLTKHIGVSNCNIATLNMLRSEGTLEPEALQVELHPYLPQQTIYDYCRLAGIVLTGYAPLGSRGRKPENRHTNEPDLFTEPAILEMAKKHGCTPAQAILAYGATRKTGILPRSTNQERLKENFDSIEMKLDREDLRKLIILPKFRFFKGEEFTINGSPYRLTDIWEY